MIKACNITKNSVVEIAGAPHTVENIVVQTPSARGGATLYKIRFRNIKTQQKVDQTLRGDDPFKEADFDTREVQYLYKNGDIYTFMDVEDYSQFELNEADIEDAIPYLVEDMEGITALMSDGRVLCIRMPDVVEMKIEQCDPSIKGASATARNKPATMTTGLTVLVPEYISQGEVIRVDTRTKAFVSRA
ncbi:MAG: elongation factor P-like protein YeiP [Kiritimatiellia bacterium]